MEKRQEIRRPGNLAYIGIYHFANNLPKFINDYCWYYLLFIVSILNAVWGLITGNNKNHNAKSLAKAMHENMHLPIMVGDGIELRRISGKDDNMWRNVVQSSE